MPVKGLRGATALAVGLVTSSLLVTGEAAAAPADCTVAQSMISAGDYWVANGPDQAPNNWQNATFHVGNLALVRTTGVSNHKTLPWADAAKYQLQPGSSPDALAAGEAYLDLFTYFHPEQPSDIAALRTRVAEDVTSVQQGKTDSWDYVEALNRAMPSYARLGVLDKNEADLDAMQKQFHYTEKVAGGHGLFNELTGLWRRDAKSTTFWSRGNGEALSALTKVLQVLPENDSRRAEYVRVFKKMAFTIKLLQRWDGFWNTDLINPFNAGGPESSGTAYFTYGIAWGINAGILDAGQYKPVVDKGWQALSTKALQPNGLLGYVQPEGTKPAAAKATDTAAYGVGAFLLAGQQVAALTPGCSA
jgi:unsaturated rhamnogalacturonyl hydrolase